MDWQSLECPRCGTGSYYLLYSTKERHLRQCSNCDRWMIAHADAAGRDYRVDSLGHPPTCPVSGCEEVLQPDQLAPHITENHEGASL